MEEINLSELKSTIDDFKLEMERIHKKNVDFMTFCRKAMKKQSENIARLSQKIFEANRITDSLQKIKATNEIVEESLCNVLLAIRQNEYLQAWYPAQHGFPDMKVPGIHPAKLKKDLNGSKKGE